MVYVELLVLYSTIIGLPWKVYLTFVLEEQHGFNKQVSHMPPHYRTECVYTFSSLSLHASHANSESTFLTPTHQTCTHMPYRLPHSSSRTR